MHLWTATSVHFITLLTIQPQRSSLFIIFLYQCQPLQCIHTKSENAKFQIQNIFMNSKHNDGEHGLHNNRLRSINTSKITWNHCCLKSVHPQYKCFNNLAGLWKNTAFKPLFVRNISIHTSLLDISSSYQVQGKQHVKTMKFCALPKKITKWKYWQYCEKLTS